MALRLLSLLVLVVTLRESCFGSSSHSLKYFYTGISEPDQGQPHFVAVGFVDDQILDHYDSHSRKLQPRVSWMEKVGKEDPKYWDRKTQAVRVNEELFRESLENLRKRYNQSEGLHTWQWMYGCELQGNESKGGNWQYGYKGKTLLTFDKKTLTWVASDPQAQITRRKWDALRTQNQYTKFYLEKECIDWIKKYLSYGKEMLMRTVPESNQMGLIIGCIVGGLVLVCLIAGISVFLKKHPNRCRAASNRRQDGYNAASTSDKGPNSSDQGSNQVI